MLNMLSFKGIKGKDSKKVSVKSQVTSKSLVKNILEKSLLPPSYSVIDRYSSIHSKLQETCTDVTPQLLTETLDKSSIQTYFNFKPSFSEKKSETNLQSTNICYPHSPDKYSPVVAKLLTEIIDINSANNNLYSDIMKITSDIDLVFDKNTGNLKEITSIMNDDIDCGYLPQKFNIPIPEVIKWLNKKHIIHYSRKTIGTILIIDSKEVVDDYPECVSCVLFEKVNENDNFDIKVVVNLKYEDRYIKKAELLDVIYTNMNNFWVIIKQENDIHLLYYYKTQKDALLSKNSSTYSYTEFILEDYTFICSMWAIYDISPDVIYMVIHDKFKYVSIQQYTIRIDDNDIPIIELYSVDSRLNECGKFLSFCANYNISIFSLVLELENNEKHFYTAIMALSQLDDNKRTEVRLDFSKTILSKNVSNEEAQLMIYNIMKKTEESINLQDKIKNETILKAKKKYLANKDIEKAKNELERRDKEAKEMADKLLEEEENESLKKKKIQLKKNKDKEKQKLEKLEKLKKEKELLEQERLKKAKIELEKECLEFEKECIEQERLNQERLLEQERLEKEMLEQERLLEQEKLENKRLKKAIVINAHMDKIRLEKVRIEKEKLEKQSIKNENPIKNKKIVLKKTKNVSIKVIESKIEEPKIEEPKIEEPKSEEPKIEESIIEESKNEESKNEESKTKIEETQIIVAQTSSDSITKPFYYSSNEIELNYTHHSLYFMFIYNISMIDPIIANEIAFSQSIDQYNEVLFKHRFYVMYALDILVINSSFIYDIKKIMDRQKDKDFPISAIYGSYLPILYSILLNDLGFKYNPFGKDINPLDKLKDYDTLELKILHEYHETHTDNEFIREASMLIGYNTDDKPVTRTKIQSSSIHNLICKCWDLNYTSAILLFEDNQTPYIKRNPDFTEFLFGQQPIQLLFGKNETNLYDYTITMNRLKKAFNTWY